MLLRELLFGCDDALFFGVSPETEITSPFCDTRETVRGGLFICLRGISTDGHCHAKEAHERGAAAVVGEYPIEGVPCVAVKDTRSAASVIWNNFYGRPGDKMKFFGITGTNGKTTTAVLLDACFKAAGYKTGVMGTLGCFLDEKEIITRGSEKGDIPSAMTTPDPKYLYGTLAEFLKMGATHCVMEVSSHGINQKKTENIDFFAGVFTNLSPEHLDFFKTMEDYYRTKASFIERCKTKIINCDDPFASRLAQSDGAVRASRKMLEGVSFSNKGVSYTYLFQGEKVRIESPLLGEFSLYNTLFASLCALTAGVDRESVQRGIGSVRNVVGRMERAVKREEWGFDLYIDYAHTPAALESVLSSLRRSGEGRLICVFGCGGDRDREKRPLMGRIAQRWAHEVIVTNDNPRNEDSLGIIRNIIVGMEKNNCIVIPDRGEAIYCAVMSAKKGDTVLLAGKGHETYEIGPYGKRSFDERKIVREALMAKYGK